MTPKTQERLKASLEHDTLAEAVKSYGTTHSAWWKAIKNGGYHDQAKTKYAADIKAGLTRSDEALALMAQANRDRGATQKANMLEDAEWLAITGENMEGAVRRLGFKSENALFMRLSRYERTDLYARFQANGDNGYVRGGSIAGPTHGSRM